MHPEGDKVAVPARSTVCLPGLFKTSIAMPVVQMVAIPCAAVFALNAEFLLLVSTISEQLQIRFYAGIPKMIARDTFK